jgi:hypothetical protein
MPMRQFISDGSFNPEAITAMSTAFDGALKTLGVTDRTGPLAEMVAVKIIEVARHGELDPKRLCELALKGVRR